MSRNHFLIPVLLLLLPSISGFAHAADYSFTVAPRVLVDSRKQHHPAFTGNGFAAPSEGILGLELRFIRHFDSPWQAGLQLAGLGNAQENGSSEATYTTGLFGAWVGYDFLRNEVSTLTLGSGVGFSSSEVEVLSTVRNGRFTNVGFYLDPTLQYWHRLGERFHLGASSSYLLAFDSSRKTVGQDLGIAHILPKAASFAIQLSWTWDKKQRERSSTP
jgi:hypothetical protein